LGSIYDMILPWLGKGLITANGEGWARNRRLLTPAFHFDMLQPYVTVYNQAADVLMVGGIHTTVLFIIATISLLNNFKTT
jgi:cytochrome P450